MGLPPQVAAMIQGGGPGPGPGGPPPGMGPGGPPPPQGGDSGDHPAIQFLKIAMDNLQKYEQAEKDPEDQAVAAKVYALLRALMAKDQKEADAATGASPAVKYVRKASSGGPY